MMCDETRSLENRAPAPEITREALAEGVKAADEWLEQYRDVIELGGGGNHLEELVRALFDVFRAA